MAPEVREITAEGLSIPEIGVGSPSFVLYAAVVQMETTPRYGGPGSSPGGGPINGREAANRKSCWEISLVKRRKEVKTMAKIDIQKIAGFDTMTPEEKIAALQGFDFPDPDYSGYVKKDLYDKAASDVAAWKKKHHDLLSEDERKKQEEAEERASMEQKLADFEKKIKISEYKTKLVSQGYDEELATATAAAMESGDMDTVFANNQKFLDGYAKRVIADKLKRTPRGVDGGTGSPMTKDAFRKMSPADRYDFSQKHPEEYKALYETGGNE